MRQDPDIHVEICAEEIGHCRYRWRPADCDVYLRIDDSQNFKTPAEYRPLIYYLSDSHVPDGVDRKAIAEKADYSFCAQSSAMKASGGFADEWLPHRAFYFPERPKEPIVGVSSVMVLSEDNPIFRPRTIQAQRIVQILPKVSTSPLGERVRIGPGIYHAEMADAYAGSQIVWSHSVNNDVSMRLFEGAASGACVVTNEIDNTDLGQIFGDLIPTYEFDESIVKNFQPGIPIESYEEDACVDLLRDLLDKPDECRERGRELSKLVKSKYTYDISLDRILQKAGELIGVNNEQGKVEIVTG